MTRQEIMEKLKDIVLFADENGGEITEKMTESSKIITDLGFTSVNMLYMVIAIEESFNIRFDNVGMADFVTVGDLVDYIAGKVQ